MNLLSQHVRAALILMSGTLLVSCSSDKTSLSEGFYIAPEASSSGASVNGVDSATGKLARSVTDLSSSTLNFSRTYISQGATTGALGGWQHRYSSQFDGAGIAHKNWQGTKSKLYDKAENACTQGWNTIKATAYNGKLKDSQAIYHQGLCDIYLDSDIVASLPIQNSQGKTDFPLHTLKRPDGTLTTFFEKQGEWHTTTHAPLRLKQNGD